VTQDRASGCVCASLPRDRRASQHPASDYTLNCEEPAFLASTSTTSGERWVRHGGDHCDVTLYGKALASPVGRVRRCPGDRRAGLEFVEKVITSAMVALLGGAERKHAPHSAYRIVVSLAELDC
jgi:hypothetical protein